MVRVRVQRKPLSDGLANAAPLGSEAIAAQKPARVYSLKHITGTEALWRVLPSPTPTKVLPPAQRSLYGSPSSY